MEIILFVVVPGVSSLRVYAISGKKLYLALIVLILGFVPVVTNLYNYIESAHANPLYTGNLPVFNITAYGSHMTNICTITSC
ncbi:hypothetical protein AcW1_002959 [Taiwanofungus camphoratus]|nr:hypothetical protein AcW1_002959 [Antrodia cinnamomea]